MIKEEEHLSKILRVIFFGRRARVQSRYPRLITSSIDVQEECGVSCFWMIKEEEHLSKILRLIFFGRRARVRIRYPRLITSSIDVQEEYGLSRSFRRGSNSKALNRGVSEVTIDRNNR